MALTPQNNDAFFREVDDDLRRDRLIGFWRRWGRILIAGAVAALALLALGLWWGAHVHARADADGDQFATVLADVQQGRVAAKDPRLAALAGSPRKSYRALARLTQAGIVAAVDPKEAAARYQALADDDVVPQAIRDLALVRATTLMLDTLPPAAVVTRMRPLVQSGTPWFGSAAELTAMADLRMNRRDLAGPLFAAIVHDPEVPASLRGRAAAMASALGQSIDAGSAAGVLKE